MRVWLVTIGEPVPVGAEASARLLRTGLLARHLAQRGHEVVWWSSTFDHTRKVQRFTEEQVLQPEERLELRLLRGCGYARNVSLARFRDHRQIAARFAAEAPRAQKPDIILCSLPTVELCRAATRYGRAAGVPVVLDMRDMWPDLFVEALPALARPFGRALLAPLFAEARAACSDATAIIGHTDAFMQWGVRRAGRAVGPLDRVFPMGYPVRPVSEQDLRSAEEFWRARGVMRQEGRVTACFVGALSRVFDFDAVLAASALTRRRGGSFRVIMCGVGERLEACKRAAMDNPDVLFAGWVDAAQIHVLLRLCDFGLDPLPDRTDFTSTVNNKAVEYLSAGLPILASPAHGALHELLTTNGCGVTYGVGDATALADAVQRLAGDRAALDRMRRNASELFERRFRAEKVNADFEAYLGEVVAAYRDGRASAPR